MNMFRLALLASLLAFSVGCDSGVSSSASAGLVQKKETDCSDAPLVPYQEQLLDIAFQAASRIPVDPHIKDRSKAQELTVVTCLELDQPTRAARYTESLENWRRGMCLAELAFYDATRGKADAARQCLEQAAGVADTVEDWRRDRIRARIAQVHAVLEQGGRAEEGHKDATTETFDTQIVALDEQVARGDFDATRNALYAYADMFKRFFSNEGRRNLVEERIRSSWKPMPLVLRFDLLIALADSAVAHDDREKALALVDEAQQMIEQRTWPLEHRIPMLARVAGMRHAAGDTDRARASADAALALFNGGKGSIVDIWRAAALRPVAETYQAMGDTAAAIAVYKLAIAEGAANPNSRPCAEDLVATCSSMAQHGVEPDAELWSRIRNTFAGLGTPW